MAIVFHIIRAGNGTRALATGVSQPAPPEGVEGVVRQAAGMIFAVGPRANCRLGVAAARAQDRSARNAHPRDRRKARQAVPAGRARRSYHPGDRHRALRVDLPQPQCNRVLRSVRADRRSRVQGVGGVPGWMRTAVVPAVKAPRRGCVVKASVPAAAV